MFSTDLHFFSFIGTSSEYTPKRPQPAIKRRKYCSAVVSTDDMITVVSPADVLSRKFL